MLLLSTLQEKSQHTAVHLHASVLLVLLETYKTTCAWPVWESGVVTMSLSDGHALKGECRLGMSCHVLRDRGKSYTPVFPCIRTGQGNQKRKQVEQRLGRQKRELISLRSSAG